MYSDNYCQRNTAPVLANARNHKNADFSHLFRVPELNLQSLKVTVRVGPPRTLTDTCVTFCTETATLFW